MNDLVEANDANVSADAMLDPDFVKSLARGLAVIRVFDADHPALNLTEIAKRAEISPAAARRFLRTLMQLGYVHMDGRLFSLTPRILELGFSYLSALSLPQVVQPHLELLSQKLEESVSCAVLSGDEIVYVARVSPRRIMTVGITIGTRFPAAATSMGRVLLEAVPTGTALEKFTQNTITDPKELTNKLRQVKEQGFALVNGELEAGLCSIAVPIRDKSLKVSAAINVSTTSSRFTPKEVENEFLPQLLQTASNIENDLRLL